MIEIKRIDEKLMTYIYDTHMRQDFPPEELKPLKNMVANLNQGLYIPYGVFLEDNLVGYAFFIKCDTNNYLLLDYYAMFAECRNKGYGSQALKYLGETCKDNDGIILEVESLQSETSDEIKKENETRKRRISFYTRNGLQKTKVLSNAFTVDYNIYYLPCNVHAPDDYDLLKRYEEIYLQFLGEKIYRNNVKTWLEP